MKVPDFGLMSEAQAAKALGKSAGTLKDWRETGSVKLPHVRLGRRVHYRPADLEAFIRRNTVNAVD